VYKVDLLKDTLHPYRFDLHICKNLWDHLEHLVSDGLVLDQFFFLYQSLENISRRFLVSS